jgi:uncharacterized protein YidB (DUF937 family)
MPDEVQATVTGTASGRPGSKEEQDQFDRARLAAEDAARRIRFSGDRLSEDGEANVLEVIRQFRQAPGGGNRLNFWVSAQTALAQPLTPLQVDARVASLKGFVETRGQLAPDEVQVKAATP